MAGKILEKNSVVAYNVPDPGSGVPGSRATWGNASFQALGWSIKPDRMLGEGEGYPELDWHPIQVGESRIQWSTKFIITLQWDLCRKTPSGGDASCYGKGLTDHWAFKLESYADNSSLLLHDYPVRYDMGWYEKKMKHFS